MPSMQQTNTFRSGADYLRIRQNLKISMVSLAVYKKMFSSVTGSQRNQEPDFIRPYTMLNSKPLSVGFVKIRDLVEKEVNLKTWDRDIRIDMLNNLKTQIL